MRGASSGPAFDLVILDDQAGGLLDLSVGTVTATIDGVAIPAVQITTGNTAGDATVRIDVPQLDQGEVLVIDPLENDEDVDLPVSGAQLNLVSIDGQSLNFGDTIMLTGGELTLLEDGRLQFRSTGQADGIVSFVYQVRDDQDLAASARVTINLRTVVPAEMTERSESEIISPIDSAAAKNDAARRTEPVTENPLYIGRAVRDSQAQTDQSIIRNRDNIVTGNANRFAWDATLAQTAENGEALSAVQFAHVRADRVFGSPGIDPIATYDSGNYNLVCWADDTPQSVLALNQLLSEQPDSQLARETEPARDEDSALCGAGDQDQKPGEAQNCDPVSRLTPPELFSRFTEQLARVRMR